MEQETTPPAQPAAPGQPNNPPILKKPILRNKNLILGVSLFILLILLIPLILLSTSRKPKEPPISQPNKTWEIILNYNNQTGNVILKKLSLLNKEIQPDFRSAQDSNYELVVVDNTDRALFRTKINITQQFIFQPLSDPISSASAEPQQPLDLETIMYIPYQPTASKIAISKDYSPILQINISPAVSLNLIPEAFAQTTPQSCGPLQVVFISDGYTDINKYHQHVNAIENKIKSTAPYSMQPAVFDFKMIDNQQPLGCTQGLISCMNNASKLYQVGYGSYPSASKFIVLVNVTNPYAIDTPGLTNDIGGNMALLFTNLPGAPSDLYVKIAAHEFLGHAVGKLYDRYVRPNYPNLLKQNIKSNCTDNPQGEVFWKQAGATGAFKGCSNPNLYAPFPLSCGGTQPGFTSLGSPQTIMSADGCNSDTFDAVEQAWIRQNVLPLYQTACPASPQATILPQPTAPPPAGLGPSPNTSATSNYVQGYVFVDLNRNSKWEYLTSLSPSGSGRGPESGFNGATVQLDDKTTVTGLVPFEPNELNFPDPDNPGHNGFYFFTEVPLGRHTVTLTVPQGYQIIAPNSQVNDPYSYTGYGPPNHPYGQEFTLLAPNKLSFVTSPKTANFANIWFGIAPVSPTPTQTPLYTPTPTPLPTSTSTSPTQAPSPTIASSTYNTYICDDTTAPSSPGSQIQIRTLNCRLVQ